MYAKIYFLVNISSDELEELSFSHGAFYMTITAGSFETTFRPDQITSKNFY